MIVVADGIVFRQSLTSVTECQDLDLVRVWKKKLRFDTCLLYNVLLQEERLKSDHGFRTVSITCCSKENLCNKDFQSSLSSESVQAIENVENIGNELVANAGSLARGGESPQSQIDKLLEENSVSRPSGSFLWTFLTIITMNVMLKLLK